MKNKLLIMFIIIFFILLIIGLPTVRKVQVPTIPSDEKSYNKSTDIENVPGVTDVKKFSDRFNISKQAVAGKSPAAVSKPTPTLKPLPYPRISINYSMARTSSIRNESLDKNYTFLIITLDIRNYGYKYFDAHPAKFKIALWDREIVPLLNISTGNMLDEVIPDNSRTKGDLVFLLSKRQTGNPRIVYTSGNYEIIYAPVSASSTSRGGDKKPIHDYE